jgi:Ssp1 endopeptidase immunity protein Rap1a
MSLIKKTILILLSIGLLNSNIVLAEEEEPELLTAGELLESCEKGSVPGAPNTGCVQYVVGLVLTVMQLHQAEQSAPFFCINPQLNPKEEVTDKVIAHLRKQSSRSKEAAQTLALEALTKNYPCTGTGGQA